MSGNSYTESCPNCKKQANINANNSPLDTTDIDCPHCGFYTYTTTGYFDLDELNDNREDEELAPLTKLPEQTFGV